MKKKAFLVLPILALSLVSCSESFSPVAKEKVPETITQYKANLPENIKKSKKTKGIQVDAKFSIDDKKIKLKGNMAVVDGYIHNSLEAKADDFYLYLANYVQDGFYYTATNVSAVINGERKEVKSYVKLPLIEVDAKIEFNGDEVEINNYLVSEFGGGIKNVSEALDDISEEIEISTVGASLEIGSDGGIKIVRAEGYLVFDNAARIIEEHAHVEEEKTKLDLDLSVNYNAKFKIPNLKDYITDKEMTDELVTLQTEILEQILIYIGIGIK